MQDLFSQVYVLIQLDLTVDSFEAKGKLQKLQKGYISRTKSKNPLSFNSSATPSLSQIINGCFLVHFIITINDKKESKLVTGIFPRFPSCF